MSAKEFQETNLDEEDDSVYGEQGREELVEAGGLSPEEDAFMQGYEDEDDSKEDEVY